MTITPKFKKILYGLVTVLVLGGLYFAYSGGYMDNRKVTESTTVSNINKFDTVEENIDKSVAELPAPSKTPAAVKGAGIRMGQMQWESQFPSLLANGGPSTTKGSLMEQAGLNLTIVRQDNCMAGIGEIVKCATAYKQDKNTTEGFHFYNVMGDGVASFMANLETQLKPLGPDYRPVILPYAMGKSYGADAVWLPITWITKNDDGQVAVIKDSLKGSVISTVPKDGDWNIVVNLASINGIPMNWDLGTYDPEAINIHAVDDYQKAADACIANNGAGVTEELAVKKGKSIGGKKTVHVRGFSSWSPEDKEAAENAGGFVRVLSTRDYDNQMPNIMITFKKYVDDNKEKLADMILAFAKAADQIKVYPKTAIPMASKIAVEVYGAMDASYFREMYLGGTVTDATGEQVEVGGNRVMNLADNMQFWGLADGSTNIYKTVYMTYGNIIAKNYPGDMPNGVTPFNKIVDVSLLQDAYDKSTQNPNEFLAKAAEVDYSKTKTKSNMVLGKANYPINFETGSATFNSDAYEILNSILDQATNSTNSRLEINGYTDDVGDNGQNQTLSERRAQAVEDYFRKKAPNLFAKGRVKSQGFGEDNPVAQGTSESARRANRRVEIIFKSN